MKRILPFILLALVCGCASKPTAPMASLPPLPPPVIVSKSLVRISSPRPAVTNILITWVPDNSVPGEVSVVVSSPTFCKPDTNWTEVFRGATNECLLPIDFSVPAKFFAAYSDFGKTTN